jgi:hypothetical protein
VRGVHGSGLVQAHACLPKQRICVPPERADKRADSPALDQPATAARFPLPASPAHQVIKVVWASHGDQRAERAELGRADARGHVIIRELPHRRFL